MNPKWLLPVALFLGLMLMGLAGASKPVARIDLWLDKYDAPITAQANSLSPVIDCINRVDVHWRVAYELYKSPKQAADPVQDWIANRHDFDDDGASDARSIQRDICSPKISEKLKLLEYDTPLTLKADAYVQTLLQVTPLTEQMLFYRQAAFSPPSFELPTGFATQFAPKAEAYLNASAALRQRVESLDVEQRRVQLNRIEARLGKDIHWYLLAYMIQARDTLNLVSEGVKNRTLTPQALAKTTAELQLAWDYRQQFTRHQFPQTQKRDEVPRYLWSHIAGPAQKYLDALNTLHKDWRNKAEPQHLSDDFHAVTRGYDSLISHYNRQARAEY
ncbi:DUF3829 domain-containing protein [Pseudomonas sp. GT1P32]